MVRHTTDPPVLQNASALMHPLVTFELLDFALARLKIRAELRPLLEGLGDRAWSEFILIVIP